MNIQQRVSDDIGKAAARIRVRRATGDRRVINRTNHKQLDRRSGNDRRNRILNIDK